MIAQGRIAAGLVLVAAAAAIGAAALAEPRHTVDEEQRAALAAVGAALVLLRWVCAAGSLRRTGATAAVLVWAGLALGGTIGGDLRRVVVDGELNLWSHYHYLLNAKYFPELGYTRLYEQTVAVDRERRPHAIATRRLRDLVTYDRVKITTLGARVERDPQWTDARWAAFRADLEPFVAELPWQEILLDRGYNATPTGNAVYRQLARLPIRDGWLQVVGLLDLALLAAAFGAAAWAFGPVRALIGAAWLALYPGNPHRLVGFPLQYDYLVALLLTASAWRAGRPALAGALLGYAAMARVFPGLLVAGLLVWAAGRGSAGGGVDRRVLRFCAGFAVACALLFGVGSLSARGPRAWAEWEDKLALHSAQHVIGERRLGLQHLFTYAAPEDGGWPSEGERARTWEARRPAWLVAAAIAGLVWLVGGVRGGRRGEDPLVPLAVALSLAFAGVVVSRYYGSAAVLLVLLGRGRDGERGEGEPLAAGLLALAAAHYAYAAEETDPYAQYLVSNTLTAVAWAAVLLWRALSPPPDAPTPPAPP